MKAPAELVGLDPHQGVATIREASGGTVLQAHLIVAADGADSCARRFCGLAAEEKAYAQSALVANIGLNRPHHQQAYGRSTPVGPLALLPVAGLRAALV